MVACHNHRVNNKCENSKNDIDQSPCQERLDTTVVAYPLHDVSQHFYIEKRDGQPHQFVQKIGDECDAYPGCDVQGEPTLYQSVCCLSECEYDLGDQCCDDKIEIAAVDPEIDDRLCNEWKYQADDTSGKHCQNELENKFMIRPKVMQ